MNKQPAFPTTNGQHDGMTLRDWFAGQAITGIIASTVNAAQIESISKVSDIFNITPLEAISKMAYEYADAMLKAREND